jgi:hypothetical protein
MNVRLFTVYTLAVLLLEALGALAYYKTLAPIGISLTMQPYQLGIAAVLVAIGGALGLAVGYEQNGVHEIGFTLILVGLIIKGTIVAFIAESMQVPAAMIIATAIAALLGRAADYAIETIELNFYHIDLGRH